jgi:catechol 2,3-dioxygenase-like lactoylglutathione lyase family enzyme
MAALSIRGNIIFTYYHDLTRAAEFYANVMGLELVLDQGFAKVFQLTPHTFIGLVDGEKGTHRPSDTKPVIIASVSDDVEKWYQHLIDHGVEIKKPLKENSVLGLRGFMALDPEGYVLEFEQFFDTERNHKILEALA